MNRSSLHPLRIAPAPIFVVGSPRSGTSVLTWCLGQHTNLLALEESGWMGDLAADLGARYAAGSRRGERSQLAAMGVDRDVFMAEFGVAIDNLVARHQIWPTDSFQFPGKTRWVDGTPEYSLHICGLRKLFPAAKFVHIVRDVDQVVASMLNFHRLNGECLVADTERAYLYWKATVEACIAAERTLGDEVVHRLRYADLVENPQSALADVLMFLDEPYEAACREPLLTRINSSNVPADFVVDTSQVDPELLRAVRELSRSLQKPSCRCEAFHSVSVRFSEAFEERVEFVATLDDEYAAAQHEIVRLNAELEQANAWALAGEATANQRGLRIVEMQSELEQANAWALACDETIRQRDARVVEMQSELAMSTRWALHLRQILSKFGALLIVQCLLFVALCLAGAFGLRAGQSLAMPAYLVASVGGALAFVWMRRTQFLSTVRGLRYRL